MHVSKKILLLLILVVSCTLSTGFFTTNEDPEDAIIEVMKAIENNDAKAFNDRIPTGYWESFFNDYIQSENAARYTWLKDIITNTESMKALTKLKLTYSRFLHSAMVYTLPEVIAALVTSGDFANFCQKYKSPSLPFSPKILSTLSYDKEGSDKYKGISSAIATMPDGQKSVLGLAKIEKKWYIVSNADSRKVAMDKALIARDDLQAKMQRIAKRKKSNDAYIKELKPHAKQIQQYIKDNEWKKLAELNIKTVGPIGHEYRRIHFTNPQSMNQLWDDVYEGIVLTAQHEAISEQRLEYRQNILKSLDGYAEYWKNFSTTDSSEVLWEKNKTRLIKEIVLVSNPKPKSVEHLQKLRVKWLNDNIQDLAVMHLYRIEHKQNGIWHTMARSQVRYDAHDPTPKSIEVYPFNLGAHRFTLKVEPYMLELAKRFEDLYAKAKIQIAKEKN